MSKVKELEELLKKDIMVELEESIEELVSKIKKKKNDKALKDEVKYMRDVQKYFDDVLADIDKNILTEEDAIEILDALEDMKVENQEV
ncbi:hypothetical protein [Arcobacter sp. LA11]|uniref:hypothetical protein n=1 Tax=Arcobacter sp. LA11 TaxID=1898176 RepID=UPI0009341467|nr:hypothetical protein [Arcobacter sp. LA11]